MPAEPAVFSVSGLEPSAIPVLMDTNDTIMASNVVLEATVPLDITPEPIPVMVPTNAPEPDTEETVPVG